MRKFSPFGARMGKIVKLGKSGGNLVGIETKGAVQTSSPGSPGGQDHDDQDDDY